jgi:hypothetical protein
MGRHGKERLFRRAPPGFRESGEREGTPTDFVDARETRERLKRPHHKPGSRLALGLSFVYASAMTRTLPYLFLFLALTPALAACPKNKKEWQAQGPKIFVRKAAKQKARIELPDFSAKLGKKGYSGTAQPFTKKKTEFALVQASDQENSLFLSGVLKCDEAKKEPVLMSLTWVKGDQSGLVKVTEQ